jgi:WD40 repeat protein
VYFTALSFTPTTSIIYQKYHDSHVFPSISGGYQHSWSPLLLVLAEHEDSVNSVAFSPDGTRIPSGSYDCTIRVWHSDSGAEALPALRGHEDAVVAVTILS